MSFRVRYLSPVVNARAAEIAGGAVGRKDDRERAAQRIHQSEMQAASIDASAAQQMRSLAAVGYQREAERADNWNARQWQAAYDQNRVYQANEFEIAAEKERRRAAREDYDYKFSKEQEQQFYRNNKAEQFVADMERLDGLPPEAARVLRYNINAANAGIQPMAVPKVKEPSPEEKMDAMIVPYTTPNPDGTRTKDPYGRMINLATGKLEMPPGDDVKAKEREAAAKHRIEIANLAKSLYAESAFEGRDANNRPILRYGKTIAEARKEAIQLLGMELDTNGDGVVSGEELAAAGTTAGGPGEMPSPMSVAATETGVPTSQQPAQGQQPQPPARPAGTIESAELPKWASPSAEEQKWEAGNDDARLFGEMEKRVQPLTSTIPVVKEWFAKAKPYTNGAKFLPDDLNPYDKQLPDDVKGAVAVGQLRLSISQPWKLPANKSGKIDGSTLIPGTVYAVRNGGDLWASVFDGKSFHPAYKLPSDYRGYDFDAAVSAAVNGIGGNVGSLDMLTQ